MRSNGEAIRDFVYIDDIVELYSLLAKNLFVNPKNFLGKFLMQGQILNIK